MVETFKFNYKFDYILIQNNFILIVLQLGFLVEPRNITFAKRFSCKKTQCFPLTHFFLPHPLAMCVAGDVGTAERVMDAPHAAVVFLHRPKCSPHTDDRTRETSPYSRMQIFPPAKFTRLFIRKVCKRVFAGI